VDLHYWLLLLLKEPWSPLTLGGCRNVQQEEEAVQQPLVECYHLCHRSLATTASLARKPDLAQYTPILLHISTYN
jgi:hypothetical protein